LETMPSVPSHTSSSTSSGITLAAVDPPGPPQYDDAAHTDSGRAFVPPHPHRQPGRLGSSKPGGRERAPTIIPSKHQRWRLSIPMEGTLDHIRHHHHVQGARQLEQPILSARSWQSSRSVDIDMTSSTTTIATSCTTTVFLQPIDEIEQVNDIIKRKHHPADEAGAETATEEECQYKVIARLSSPFVEHSSPLPSVVVNLKLRRHTVAAGSWQGPTLRDLIGTSECPLHPPPPQPAVGHRYSVSLSWSGPRHVSIRPIVDQINRLCTGLPSRTPVCQRHDWV
jgi:hypothetical protein